MLTLPTCTNIQTIPFVMLGTPMLHTYSSRNFTRDVSGAKRAACEGPVFISDRGRPAFVLLNIDEYNQLLGQKSLSLLDAMMAIPCQEDIEFEPQQVEIILRRPEWD